MWLHETRNYYSATGNSKASLVDHQNPEVLGLRGFVFDKILGISDLALDWETDDWHSFGAIAFKEEEWRGLGLGPWSPRIWMYSSYAHGTQRKNAFYNTITANVFGNEVVDWEFIEQEYSRNRRVLKGAKRGRKFPKHLILCA
jgi:hypothetical protein